MINLYNSNGVMFWSEKEIMLRNQIKERIALTIHYILRKENPAWQIIQMEGSTLLPAEHLSNSYSNEDVFYLENSNLVMRPETTKSSYLYSEHLMTLNEVRPPVIIWQAGKSYRREQDQVTKNMRLKEFYQQEFQCIFATDTKNDYYSKVLEPIRNMFTSILDRKCNIVKSDRLPSYSTETMDVEVETDHGTLMEVCSISRRIDFTHKFNNKDLSVLEIAIGLDRCLYLIDKI